MVLAKDAAIRLPDTTNVDRIPTRRQPNRFTSHPTRKPKKSKVKISKNQWIVHNVTKSQCGSIAYFINLR